MIPLALICGLYLWLLLRLWRGAAPGGHVSAESRRGKKRVTRMVIVVVAIFAVCWFPIQVSDGTERKSRGVPRRYMLSRAMRLVLHQLPQAKFVTKN